ncbi:putative adrenomedullin-5-like protein [Octodon degus]|uniref:Adrenomedullin-5-like protein n=1 Tax=Octodon degus TaxID=10160 RepID=A0A6P6DR36_OCTDE|nr:putative adrenomedullin-5-like protein [Octodon degus]
MSTLYLWPTLSLPGKRQSLLAHGARPPSPVTMAAHVLLLLLAASALGNRDSMDRRPQAQLSQRRGRSCWLGTCQTHLLPHRLAWVRALPAKEPSGKAAREPQDPRSYGRRRRDAPGSARLGLGVPGRRPRPAPSFTP